ncbi:auxin-induced protein 15A-like [Ananas comosus]|uniref:Auxin-induced protein 15A-like n=2 Tax=Ananas comosus TaxID=4615 RepID=A0A6P5EEW1_ANACO|nr:auxin-induced protein 15A-like [Ananas comosus]
MNMLKRKFLGTFLTKWRMPSIEMLTCATYSCNGWALIGRSQEEESIPKDVPKGHMVVYVGNEHKRFVIRVTYLHHPLFQALLDRAEEEYDFSPDSKLCIPCEEDLFLSILHCVSLQKEPRMWLCL